MNKNYHLRELPSRRFSPAKIPTGFVARFNKQILPRLSFTGYKLKQKQEMALQVCYALLMSNHAGECVADCRDNSKSQSRLKIQVWDAFVKSKLARQCTGSKVSKLDTVYRATDKLIQEFEEMKKLSEILETSLARNTIERIPTDLALVVLQTRESGKREILRIDNLPSGVVRYLKETENKVEAVNRQNLCHGWMALAKYPDSFREYAHQINPCLRQVHSNEIGSAARLYSWSAVSGQNLTKDQRQQIKIDGEPVAEFDFSCMAIRMLYHYQNIDLRNDAYRPGKIFPIFGKSCRDRELKASVRSFIKQATNICLNTSSKREAIGAIAKCLKENYPEVIRPMKSIEQIKVSELVDRIVNAHPDISYRFFSIIGLRLMTIDGAMMLEILHRLAKQGIPALGIHDSVVCKIKNAATVENAMRDVYCFFVSFPPVIRRVY
jgi:hypothetical protein